MESLVILFQPSGFHVLFGTPTAPLSEAGTEGHAVLGPAISRLHQQLGNLESFPGRARLLDQFFLDRLRGTPTIDPVYQALHRLTLPGQSTKVSDVARRMGVNLRQLERKSLAYAGVSPKDLTRISRFSRALRLRAETSFTWTQIAHETEYHDHMHMIRDFRVFAGEAPTSALQEISPDHLINFCAQ